MASSEVTRLDLTIDETDVIRGAGEVLKVIRPHWRSDSVRFKLFTDGITNKLVGCFNQNNNANDDDDDTADDETHDVVLIRVYGNKTDLLIDRKKETENICLLHRYGYAPTLYATFRNGLAYEFVPGVTLTPDSCREERVWPLVAKRMAQMHKVRDESVGDCRKPMLPDKLDQFLKLVPQVFSDLVKDSRISQIFPKTDELRRDFDELYKRLTQLNSPTVFCHNDLLLGNVIYSADRDQVTFIDYEYAAYNHQAFDIGNHFTEFAGIDEIDYDRYPAKDFQLRWLRVYLEEFNGEGECTDSDVQRLYVQVNQFALASHFLWAVWALIQAEHSTIDFDFIQFGETRYREYLRRRDEFLSLTYQN